MNEEINNRVTKASNILSKCGKKEIPTNAKTEIHFFKLHLSILLYGTETWVKFNQNKVTD